MRKILLIIFIPVISFGQKFEVGLGIGPALFSGFHPGFTTYSRSLKTALYSDLAVAMQLKNNFNLGIKVGGDEVKSNFGGRRFNAVVYADQMIGISLFVNKYKPLSFGNIYAGVSAGLATYSNMDSTYFYQLYPNALLASARGSGFMFGCQMGINCRLSQHFGLNLEGCLTSFHLSAQSTFHNENPYEISYLTYPITIGVKYHFGIGKKYKIGKTPEKEDNAKPRKVKKHKAMSPYSEE